ncbi:Kinesin-like protein [Quillaja saponaria]|uniref:Kinesin-like protein n=1 Tax=Quillaja saponaria TaxID=32244 RepID=A0AAD7LBZ8_QUISA|nr:Kinesin-like protein [Quillaja saponaria]
MVGEKEEAIKALCLEWERATMELTTFLVDGSRSLRDASGQVEGIVSSFPQVSDWIGEHVGRAVKVYVEKEETIQLLQKSLEDAQKMVVDMERKISSLKGVTVALSESQQLEGPERMDQSMLLSEMTNMVRVLESEVRLKEDQVTQAEKRADAVFLVVKWLCDRCDVAQASDVGGDSLIPRLDVGTRLSGKTNSSVKYLSLKDLKAQIETVRLGLLELESAACAFCANTDMPSAGIQTDFCSVSSVDRDLIQDFAREIQELTTKLRELKKYCKTSQHCVVESLTTRACEKCNFENQNHILNQIREELAEMNRRLGIIENTISTGGDIFRCPLMDRKLADADAWSADSSSSDSVSSTETVGYDNKFDGSSYTCNFRVPASILQIVHPKAARGSKHEDDHIESESSGSLWETSIQNEAAILCLKKELDALYDAFSKLHVRVASLLKISKKGNCSYGKDACSTMPELEGLSPSSGLRTAKTEAGDPNDREVFEELKPAGSFFTQFEESHATIEEADLLLNALVKSNENAKQVTVVWKQAGEDLMIERASLTEEIQQLKSSISYQQKENQLLADHLDNTLVEISNSTSFLKDCFLQMQIDVEKRFEVLCSDFFLTRQQMLYFVSEWRSSVEDIFFQIMEKGFVSFILYHCLIEKFICKFPCLDINHDANLIRLEEVNNLTKICSSDMGYKLIPSKEIREGRDQCVRVKTLQGERDFSNAKLIYENLTIRKELERKEELLEGLLFDFRLLQESTSNTMDIKDETEKLIFSSRHVRNELEMKTSQLDNMLIQHRELEVRLADTEKALFVSRSELVYANEKIHKFLDQIGELRELVKDLFTRKSEAEEQLEEQKEVIWGLEQELLQLNISEEKNDTSLEGIEDELRRVIGERDQLLEEVRFLSDKLEMAYALSEENEAISVEARQESEASKQYAEEKEEEVKILENSVEELESTIHVLEKKVFEMDEEVGRHRLIRESLEVELQAFRQRLLTIERLPQNTDSESTSVQQAEGKISRQLSNKLLELHEAHNRIKVLEEEREDQDKEIKQCKEYISEVVLHAEAQASQYQQKYKTMESMFREVKAELSNSVSSAPTADKIEKTPLRTRGSSSPFRCIASLVQQMNLEKDQELSMARHHIEELEALATSRQKEVCVLNTRLAAAESMTHDVIRDLLGVKLDMTNYANLIDQHQVLKLVEEAHQHTDDFFAKEEEILYLRKQIDDLLKERESCILELKNREADNFATQITVQQLQERHQLLFAQNEILKMDKANLMKKVVDLDDMVKTLLVTPSIQQHNQQISKIKGDVDFTKRLSHPGRLVSRVNHELKYRQAGGSNQRG